MNFTNLVHAAIDTATSGTDVDRNVIQKMTMEVESMFDSAANALAVKLALNDDLRPRITKTFTVVLSGGAGTVPAGLMVEYLREGSVRDSDTSAPNGTGNKLSRVMHLNDFQFGYLSPLFSYYHIIGIGASAQISTRAAGSQFDFTGVVGPLIVTGPRVPSKLEVTDLDSEVTNMLTEELAIRLRGFIRGMEAPAA